MKLDIWSPWSVLNSITLSANKCHKILTVLLSNHCLPAFLLKSPNSGGFQTT